MLSIEDAVRPVAVRLQESTPLPIIHLLFTAMQVRHDIEAIRLLLRLGHSCNVPFVTVLYFCVGEDAGMPYRLT